MDGQRLLFAEDVDKLTHKIELLEQQCEALTRERDLLDRELRAAREEVTQLLQVLGQVAESPRRRPLQPPPAVPLWERIRQYLEASDRPKRAYQVARALQLDQPPTRELARLVDRHLAVRVKEGLYTGVGSTTPAIPAEPSVSLRQRVLRFVLEADKPVRTADVQAGLQLPRKPDRELSHLVASEKIARVAVGLYAAPKGDREEQT